MELATYRPDGRDGARFVPNPCATSPWNPGLQHGGPPAGLLARCIERHPTAEGLSLARLSVDLFRPVPMKPLTVRVETVREGRRIATLQASLNSAEVEVARASALLLRPSQAPEPASSPVSPPGPEGLAERSMLDEEMRAKVGEGFHNYLEIRPVPPAEGTPFALWLRTTLALVEGEELSPLQRAAALADLTNTAATFCDLFAGRVRTPTINPDTTLYLAHPPEGEWLCFQAGHVAERDGVGVVHASLFDARGIFGHSAQARLANPHRR